MKRLAVLFLGFCACLPAGGVNCQVRDWLSRFGRLESRYVGSPGHVASLEAVQEAFRTFGLKNVRRERFLITVPVDQGAWISGPGLAKTRIYGVWPNHVQLSVVPREGLTGRLVDAGRGEADALDGRPVTGSIALVKLPCSERPQGWLTPFVLGAAAVIFLPPEGQNFTRNDAEELFLDVPADLPRFWAPAGAVSALRAAAARGSAVRIEAKAGWREIETWNVVGHLPGSDEAFPGEQGSKGGVWKDKLVVLQAYTDGVSVVPALSPGGEQAGGLAALLELAGHFASNRVPPSLLFLATSGHYHSLSGVHEFVARHIRNEEYFTRSITAAERIEPDYFIGLDLSSGDSRIASFSQGTFYTGWEHDLLAQNAMLRLARALDGHAAKCFGKEADRLYLNGVSPPRRAWKDLLGYPAAFDAEAVINTGTPALTFATAFDARMRADTPLDTFDRVDMKALETQVSTLKTLLSSALADPAFFGTVRLKLPDRGRALRGVVHEFERTVTGLPDKPVPGALVVARMGKNSDSRKTYGPVRRLRAITSQHDDPKTLTVTETGSFRMPLVRIDEYWAWIHIILEGYQFDEDGRIALATDLGPLTGEQFSPDIWFQEREKVTLLVLQRCRPLTILEPVDARQLRFLDGLTVRDGYDQPFMNFGYSFILDQSKAQESFTPALVIFAPDLPDEEPRIKALLTCGSLGLKGLFTGADEGLLANIGKIDMESAQGRGYGVSRRVLHRAPFEGAKDMWVLDEYRGRMLADHHVRNYRIEALHQQALMALREAREAWAEMRYGDFLSSSRQAWGLESRAYPEFRSVANDLVKTVVFYCVLLMPFAFCMERLLFSYADLRRQLLATGGIFLAGFLALRQVHPAFKISSNPIIIFLGFIIMALGIVVLGIISSKFQRELRKIKGERGDYEAVDIGRISATLAAITLGLSNLRKRPLRTGLTVATVVVLTFTVLSLVSMSTTISFFKLPRGLEPAYAGALVRETAWQVMQPPVKKYIESALGDVAYVVPRSWVTARRRDELLQLEITSESKRSVEVSGLLGMVPEERLVMQPQKKIGLRGRWIREGDLNVCLVPEVLADRLGVALRDHVFVRGEKLEIIGIYEGGKLGSLEDLDGEPITPAKFDVRRGRYNWEPDQEPAQSSDPGEGLATTEHLAGNQTVIIPYDLAMSLEGRLRSVAVVPRPGMQAKGLMDEVKDFLVRAAIIALVSDGTRVNLLTSVGAVSVSGTLDLVLPIILVGLIVLNTMMGSVHERVREISIFSSVGLAPVHIGALFFAEAFVVAIVGVVLGYLVAQFSTALLLRTGTLAGLSLNYSSSAAVGACILVIAAVMLSTIYPARKASELSVPDVTRRWKLPEPEGDVMAFDFPFTVGEADLVGLFAYLADLFRAYRDSSIGSFAADRVRLVRTERGAAVEFDSWLAPYDLGISQQVRMEAVPMEVKGLYRVQVHIVRRSGEAGDWHRQNRSFLTALRKRFMIWRMFGTERKQNYARKGSAEMDAAHG